MKKRTAFLKRLLALLCSFILLPLFSLAEAPAQTPVPSALDQEVARAFRQRSTTGGMVVAAKDGKIVYKYCYGYANQGKKVLVTDDSYFRLASVSKLVTATAVMRLVETGRLDLDQNIGQVIGGDNPYNAFNPSFKNVGITPRMLMTHTSTIWDTQFAQKRPLREALKLKSSYYQEKKAPGTVYHYSNYGAGILGIVLEAVTGVHLSEAASTLIFDRMDIDAAYSPDLLEHPENVTSSFSRDYSTDIDLEHDYYLSYGGCWMKGEDLCRLGIMLCDFGMYEGARILEEDTVREMISSQAGKGGITVDSPYGLNVERVTNLVSGKMLYGHQGMADAVLCNLYFDPETRFVFALVTNGCNTKAKEDRICLLARDLFGLLWDHYNN